MTTLATQLKTQIEHWADDLRQNTQLGSLARQGKLPPRALALYLESLRYLLHNSQLNLVLASATSSRALARGRGDGAASVSCDRELGRLAT